jgi:hypothetical protein
MTAIASAESPIHYQHCPNCGRWSASPYDADLMRHGTMRRASASPRRKPDSSFAAIKVRLERWLRAMNAEPDDAPSVEEPEQVPAHATSKR